MPLSNYYTKTVTESKLADKADAKTVYTKAETDNAISGALSAGTALSASNVPWAGVQNKPIASATELGLIKVGNNLTIDSDGTLNATGSGGGGGTEGIRYKLITKTLQEGTYNGKSVLTC